MFYDSDPFLRAALSGRPRPICTLISFYICFFPGRHLGQASDARCILRIGAILPCRFRSWVLQGRWIPTMIVVIIFFLFPQFDDGNLGYSEAYWGRRHDEMSVKIPFFVNI
jgi:hypothetical protein